MFIQFLDKGTLAKEMLEQAKSDNVNFDYLFAAIGGGGLISGISTYFKILFSQHKNYRS